MDEITVPIPYNYGTIEGLHHWLKRNMPHEYHVDGGPRWRIITNLGGWIKFTRPSDASLFLLKWE